MKYWKFGIEMILATSSFTNIPRQIIENTSLFITHRIPSLRQAEAIADLFGFNHREERDVNRDTPNPWNRDNRDHHEKQHLPNARRDPATSHGEHGSQTL